MRKLRWRIFSMPPVGFLLVLFYALGVCSRLLLAFTQSQNPAIMPDESLHFNLARSLFTGGQVALRGQPVTYDSLLYALVLAPLLALPQSVDMFRAIQVLNTLLMNTAVFPAYALGYRLTGKKSSGLLVALLSLSLPDLALTELAMTENLGYPLLLTTLWLAHRALTAQDKKSTAAASACAFLLYLSKPGTISLLIAFLVVLLFRYIRRKDTPAFDQLFVGFAVALGMALLSQCVFRFVLSIEYAQASIYQTQTQPFSIGHLLQSANGVLLYLLFFPLACMALPFVIPFAHANDLEEPERHFFWMIAASIGMMILGIVYIIYIDEYTQDPFFSRVHLRYLAGYIPVLFAFSLSPRLHNKPMNGRVFAWLAFLGIGVGVFTFSAIGSGKSYPVDALALASTFGSYDFTDAKKLFTFIAPLGLAGAAYALYRHGWSGRVKAVTVALFFGFCLLNNASGYVQLRHHNDPAWAADAREITGMIPGGDMVNIAADGAFFWGPSSDIDVRSRVPLTVVELDDIMENTAPGGVYTPFLPESYWVTYAQNETPDAKWLTLDQTLLNSIALAAGQPVCSTANGLYAMLPLEAGRPWVHSALSGFNQGWVGDGSRLSIFDETLCAKETIQVQLYVRAGKGNATLTLTREDFSQSFVISDTLEWITAEVPAKTDHQPFRLYFSSDVNVLVETYLVQ